MIQDTKQLRGITLLVAVILTSVLLAVTLSLLDITYKQVLLASSAKQSQYAFYTADSLMECALYWDQQYDAFDYSASPYLVSGITCNKQILEAQSAPNIDNAPNGSDIVSGSRKTVLYVPCADGVSGDTQGVISIYKNPNDASTHIYATGYSSCSPTDPRRIERGLKVDY